jgi:hypothetical protein
MKEMIPSSSAAQIMLDDDDVLVVRWCRVCNRGRNKTPNVACPSCDGNRVVREVRQEAPATRPRS